MDQEMMMVMIQAILLTMIRVSRELCSLLGSCKPVQFKPCLNLSPRSCNMDKRIFVISSRSNEPSFIVRDEQFCSSGELWGVVWYLISVRDPYDSCKVTIQELDDDELLELLATNNRITVFNGERKTSVYGAVRRFVGKCLYRNAHVTYEDFQDMQYAFKNSCSTVFWT